MITFETEEEFQEAVMCVIAEKLGIQVRVYGDHFVRGVDVFLVNNDDTHGCLSEHSDSCS